MHPLKNAKFKLKTALRISTHHYSHCTIHPIHGTGKGSGNLPMNWCFLSSTLFDAQDGEAHGATFESYNNKISLSFSFVGFVDDCSQRTNQYCKHPRPATNTLIQQMQDDTQHWSNLLWSSDGMLQLPKCLYYTIHTKLTRTGLAIMTNTQPANPIMIQPAQFFDMEK